MPLDHRPPDWLRAEPDYFITINGRPKRHNQFCRPETASVILDSIRHRNEKGIWYCEAALLMPDHIHMLVSFPDLPSFAKVVGDWKHWLARQHKISWQENFFDHRIRNDESGAEKWRYIVANPIRAGLMKEGETWPYCWIAG